ncbi:MAG: hypothetical protein Q8L05_00485, partial [Actinomycetota bacterium]|nr:hypothetical protein [Actinomycetota bacterium]
AGILGLRGVEVLVAEGTSRVNATDHITVLDAALAQFDPAQRATVLVRTDSGGGTKAFEEHLALTTRDLHHLRPPPQAHGADAHALERTQTPVTYTKAR